MGSKNQKFEPSQDALKYIIDSFVSNAKTAKELGDEFGYHKGAIYSLLKRNGIKLTSTKEKRLLGINTYNQKYIYDIDFIKFLTDKGYCLEHISQITGISSTNLSAFFRKNNIKRNYVTDLVTPFQYQVLLDRYKSGMTLKESVKGFDVSSITFGAWLKKEGIAARKFNDYVDYKPEQHELNKLIDDYISGKSLRTLAKINKTSNDKIKSKLQELGYEYLHSDHRFPGKNHKAFSDINEEACAYFYGLLLGDGCLTRNDAVVITLKGNDASILLKLQEYLGYSTNFKMIDRPIVGHNDECGTFAHFNFSDPVVVNRLKEFGLSSAKSGKEVVPECFKLNRHFWRGLIDADGCPSVKRSTNQSFNAHLSLVSSEECVNDFKYFCESIIKCNVTISNHNKCDKIMYATLSGNSARKIMMYLYDDCELFLPRKADIAKQACSDFWKLILKESAQKPICNLSGTWTMQVSNDGKTVRETGFSTEQEAIEARDSFVNEINIKRIKENEQWLMWQRQKIFKRFGMS